MSQHQDTSARRAQPACARAGALEAPLPSVPASLTIKELIAKRKAKGQSTSQLQGTPWRRGFRFGKGN